jgi:transcriptional regulator with XRE-family HTH domain
LRKFFVGLEPVRDNIHRMYIKSMDVFGTAEMPLTIQPAMPKKKVSAKSFGERLYALRRARGFTQVRLAKALGTTQRMISYYETEAELPPSSVIVALTRILRVSADELLGLKAAKLDRQSAEEQRLWKRFRLMESLPERDRRAVIRMIHSLSAARGSEARA